jgi:hypothetical protein
VPICISYAREFPSFNFRLVITDHVPRYISYAREFSELRLESGDIKRCLYINRRSRRQSIVSQDNSHIQRLLKIVLPTMLVSTKALELLADMTL